MAPTPQHYIPVSQDVTPNVDDGEKIVISGMSGLFPESHNVKELSKILYEQKNPVTDEDCRWVYDHPELSQFSGKVPEVDRFDAQFFGIHFVLCNTMDAMARKTLEQAYQAIYDAGISPASLNDKNVGVYVGVTFSESEKTNFYVKSTKTGLGIVGCSRTMFANRISYWLNVKGPSMACDMDNCSSSSALEQACQAIKRGECEAAIVTASNLCLLPFTAIQNQRVIDIAKDGKTKSYDKNADGCANSEAISVIFLQKAKNALRIYAEVVHVKTEFIGLAEDETGPLFGFGRMPGTMSSFMRKFYKEAQVPPQAVEYVEGIGSATPHADKGELEAIEDVYLEDRRSPLLVGSVTSNIGFTQAAAELSSLVKVLLGYYTGSLAGNLHCSEPRDDVVAIRDGRMRIVTKPEPFHRTYAAVNGISITGVNSHVLLAGCYKPKNLSKYACSIPRLVMMSGRQESAVTKIKEDLKSRPVDAEEIALLHNVHNSNINGHMSRGYVILDTDNEQKTVCLSEKNEYFDDAKKPLWFVYSGMGSQWAGMGAELMRIPIFAAAIERCHRVLATKGLDLVHIITTPDKTAFDNILHSFVGIAAVQIGLTDVLTALGLTPDGIIGHSVGELGCAYADGCLTAEEMILAAYSRGLVSLETPFIKGSMAAVGLGYQQIVDLLPAEIVVACHNGPESCTISGPADKVNEFVAELTARGVFAKEVPCSNIAYHSRYIADAGPRLLQLLKEVIKTPKARTERWLSTSVPEDRWHEASAQFNSAEYHTNNLLSSVLFEETSQHIPSNAVLVEVAPHGLLQAILKRSLSPDCVNIPLTKRGHPDNALFLLQAIGTLYTTGYNPRVEVLYPKVQFPVSTETPMLSHLVEWVHVEKWSIPVFLGAQKKTASSCNFVISVHDDEHNYLQGNVVRGKTVYPFAGALVSVWDTLAMHTNSEKRNMSVAFHDVHLHVQPTLYNQHPLRLSISINRCNGYFEVMDENCKVVSGYIFITETNTDKNEVKVDYTSDYDLKQNDLYQLLYEREYNYSGDFRSIECANESLTKAQLAWQDNWITFLDGILQLNTLQQAHHAVSLPTHIRKINIDIGKHIQSLTADAVDKKQYVTAEVIKIDELTKCGGVTIQSITYRNLPAAAKNSLTLKLLPTHNAQSAVQQNSSKEEQISLQISKPGDLNSLCWAKTQQSETSGVEVTVHYAGLNTMDAKKATGAVPWSDNYNAFGMDFSGINKRGERVMGVVENGAASTKVYAEPEMLWPVPSHWSLEDAATVPLAYLQAFYCLSIKTKLQRGMSVLVHGGAGALGQAAIAIALAHDCTVFTMVSDLQKKRLLKKLYPQLKDEFIGNSRDDSFVDMVLTNTEGEGCDIILCCVPNNFKNYTMKCVKLYGIMIDITQVQHRDNYYFGMFNLEKDRNFIMADISSIFVHKNQKERKMLNSMLSKGIAQGYVRPISRVVYAPTEAAPAFKLLSASQHRGRVLLQMQNGDNKLQTQHRISCTKDAYHVLICDEKPLGMQLAERLVSRGARKLCIIGEQLTPYQRFKIRALEKLGVIVEVIAVNLNEQHTVSKALKNFIDMNKPIEGVYVVMNTGKRNVTGIVVKDVVNNLNTTAKSLNPTLKYFAVVSSDHNKEYQTYMKQIKLRIAATLMDLSLLEDACSREVVDAIEHALHTTQSVQVAKLADAQQPSLLQELENLLDIQLPDEGTSTLEEIGVTRDKVQTVILLLRDSYNLLLEEDEVLSLTIDRIKEINDIALDKVKFVEGLSTFFSYVSLDQNQALTDMVFLPTLSLNVISGGEFDLRQSYLYIVPGMEGHYERFTILCERLKLPALVLQTGFDHPNETAHETAQRYVKVLLERAKFNNNEFYLLGYESGVFVALEMAAILEAQGMTGTVFCVGYSPEEFQRVLQEHLAEYETEEQLQDSLIRHMYKLLGGNDITKINNALKSTSTWSQKIDACMQALFGRVGNSTHYVRALLLSTFTRMKQVQGYKALTNPLRSRIVLIRAASEKPAIQSSDLQRNTSEPLVIHQLHTPLGNASHDMRVPSIINNYLSPTILKNFEKRNLCHTYLINSDVIAARRVDD